MRKALIAVGMLAALVAGTLVDTAPASAAPAKRVRTVWIETKKGTGWPIHRAQQYVDKFTGSQFRYGACVRHPKDVCIKIRESWKLDPGWAGMAYDMGNQKLIELQPRQRFQSQEIKYQILVHEFGHVMGIWTHNESKSSVMYYQTGWSSVFSAAEKKILRKH